MEETKKFNSQSEYIEVYLYTTVGLRDSFAADIKGDLGLISVSIGLVSLYCIMFMGSFSPVHFRSVAAMITLFCVVLSYCATVGLLSYLGCKMGNIHQLLPFLLIGIGVDDMFVISSAIDRTDARDTVERRMSDGLRESGSSVTITSLTNAIAFFIGMNSSINALSSFCLFAGVGVIFLYLSSLTIFSAFMTYDISR